MLWLTCAVFAVAIPASTEVERIAVFARDRIAERFVFPAVELPWLSSMDMGRISLATDFPVLVDFLFGGMLCDD